MSVSRLEHMAGIGVDRMGNRADATGDASILRLENLDTDLRPPPGWSTTGTPPRWSAPGG